MKKVLTGIKPTAEQLHIWNYFWAVKPLLSFQEKWEYDMAVFVADMHALTTLHNWAAIRENIYSVIRTYLAFGLDPAKVNLYKPSDVDAHAKLNWVLSCITSLGFMKRMHVYKDYLQKWNSDELTLWTFNYPILMAADIILYDADIVPVGKDQKQHVEFARDIAIKFNNLYWDTFVIPQPYIKEDVATVPWIDWRKMSKSYNNFIGIFDSEEIILKKVKSIVTDAIPVEESKNPDNCNIYNILRLFLNEQENEEIRNKYLQWGLSFKDAKWYLYEKLIEFVSPIQYKKNQITDEYIYDVLKVWAEKANEIANAKIKIVYDKVGFNI